MKYKRPKFDSFADYRRFMVRVFVLLYIVALLGIVLKWLLEGGSFWPYAATAAITLPCFVLGYCMGMPRAKYLFDKARSEYIIPKMK